VSEVVERPLCECHGEPMTRRADRRSGWRCSVLRRETQRRYQASVKGRETQRRYDMSVKGAWNRLRALHKQRTMRIAMREEILNGFAVAHTANSVRVLPGSPADAERTEVVLTPTKAASGAHPRDPDPGWRWSARTHDPGETQWKILVPHFLAARSS
jgi:hypothetical protein